MKYNNIKKFVIGIVLLCLMCGSSRLVTSAEEKYMAVVNVSSCFLRSAPDYEASLESQCLMGTVVCVTGVERYWRKVDAPDYKNCWTNELCIVPMTNEQIEQYIASPKWMCVEEYAHIFYEPDGNAERICDFTMGDIVRKVKGDSNVSSGWVKVLLPDGRCGYVKEGCVVDFSEWSLRQQPTEEGLVSFSKKLVGIPYMWGGNSIKHFDCSGLTKFVYMMNGVILPRNAREQIACGEEVSFDFDKMRPGDLIFYGRKGDSSKPMVVSHVAIYIGDHKIIHSSQVVRINDLRSGRPDSYDRTPIAVRRILGHVDTGEGAESARKAPWYFKQTEK